MIGRRQYSESARNWLWRPSCFSEIVENQYQPSLCHLISIWNVWWRYIHNFSFNWSDVVNILSQQKNGCGGHLVFQKLLKINTSLAIDTRHVKKKLWRYLNNFFFKWSDKVSCGRLTPHASRITPHAAREHEQKLYVPPSGDIIRSSWSRFEHCSVEIQRSRFRCYSFVFERTQSSSSKIVQ